MGYAIVIGLTALFVGFIIFLTRGGTDDTTQRVAADCLEHLLADNLEQELNDYGAQEGNDGRNV